MHRYDFEGDDLAKRIRTTTAPCPEGGEEELVGFLRKDTIGQDQPVKTPYGLRQIVYTDFTASGRALGLIENYIRDTVLPNYGNTHSLSTSTARQSTFFRNEARHIIKHYFNATHEDALIFAGCGTTGAVHKFVEIMCRAKWNFDGASEAGDDETTDAFFREDRWGSCECTLCGIRVKTEAIYRAHRFSEMHQQKLAERKQPNPFEGKRRVVILLDPIAHHSSMLPFRELTKQYPHATTAPLLEDSLCAHAPGDSRSNVEIEVCTVRLNPHTCKMDEADLSDKLEKVSGHKGAKAVCIFSAGSNVTGLMADVPGITSLVHRHGGLACWDYAATAGHVQPDLNLPGFPDAAVDVAFFSPHKLLGGPSTPGLLIAKKHLFRNAVPSIPGGGVVFFVDPKNHSYIQNAEEREEAGTPDSVACIRAGLTYHIHSMLPPAALHAEQAGLEYLLQRWGKQPRIEILGPPTSSSSRSAIVSFMIRYGNGGRHEGLYLHYNYVVAILNDLFGVQARGGCACAGPYGQMLLGIDEHLSARFDECLKRSAHEVLRPGFVRIGVHFTLSREHLETLARAVEWVAERGWRLLPAYTFDADTGEWNHRLATVQQDRFWLSAVAPPVLRSSSLRTLEESVMSKATPPPADLFEAAEEALVTSFKGDSSISLTSTRCPLLDAEYASLLWFATPMDAAESLKAGCDVPKLSEDGAIFAGGSVERVSHSAFAVKRWETSEELEGAELSTRAPGSPEEEDVVGTGDADWQPFFGEWGEADDSENICDSKRFKFPASAISPKMVRELNSGVSSAIKEFDMIKEGDRLLVGLSGGKDSLTMLHALLEKQRRAKIKFEIAAATVNPETPEYNPGPLIDYMEALGVKYHFLCKPLIEMAKAHLDPKKPSICSFCARMKRGMLYSCMREHGYNVLCLGQHLDDFAESLLMSAFHNGALRTMKANYLVEAHDLRVCRPLVYVRERVMAQFAKENQLPIIQDNCPACFAAPKERHRIKLVLSEQEFEHPNLFFSLVKCMKPLMSITHTERHLRGTGLGMDDDEDMAAIGAVTDKVKAMNVDAPGTSANSDCKDGLCGLGSDGAFGLGSDDRDVASAELVAAGEDLAAKNCKELISISPVSRSSVGERDTVVRGARLWLPVALMVLTPLLITSFKRSR